MQWLKDNFPGAHKAVMSVTDTVTKPVQTALPSVATDSGSAKMLDAPSEPAGMTMSGGRRRKTCGGKRRGKKTLRGGKRRR
jgi:hypothetical protein